jgi:serine/threonine protein kinase
MLLKFDDIEIGRQIGEGGAGEVFQGRYLKKDVAIKKIKNKPQILK